MRVYVGTSGYTYPEWKGSFYPANLSPAKMLPYYAEQFSTVEINATFYRMPTAKILAGWAEATRETFVFALKASRRITHDARLRDIDEPLRYFCETAQTLGPKLGPILFQFPPNFKRDPARLGDLLVRLPPRLRCAVEFRHESWFTEEVYERLRAHNVALCIADTEKGTTPLVATADFGYFRLRDAGYSEEGLKGWSQTVRGLGARWQDAFLYFKHEESGKGPALAQRLQGLLG